MNQINSLNDVPPSEILSESTLRVLLVEDNVDARANVADILELDGHTVVEAGTIQAGLRLAQNPEINAIILDRQLPDGDAADSIHEFIRLAPNAPIVIVTGLIDLESAVRILRDGAYDYILKPISPDVLRSTLGRIAERRDTIVELQRQRDFAESLIETAQSIVLVLDPQGRIVRFNSFMSEITGYSLEEVRGREWLETFIPDKDRERIRSVFGNAVTGQRIHENINPILTKNGDLLEISWWATALRDERGEISGVLSVGHDISELRKAEQRIVQGERLAAIGQMVAGLAHESRNAFQRSQVCLEMLALEVAENSEATDLVGKIQRALDHLHHLYEEVRDYAAPISLSYSREDLPSIWRDTWHHLELARQEQDVRLFERHLDVDLNCDVDRHVMEQVFRNILENAIAACPDPGEITISAVDSELNDHPAIELSISDNGPGIKEESLENIFEPFFTTKTKGTGLGLAIVKRLIHAHHGTIRVTDGDAGGASFIICLPRSAT